MTQKVLHGVAVSAGIAIGTAFFLGRQRNAAAPAVCIEPGQVEAELARFTLALDKTAEEISLAAGHISPGLKDQAGIIAAYHMICKDPKLIQTAKSYISHNLLRADSAIEQTLQDISRTFTLIDDPYIRERLQDVRAITNRIIDHIQGKERILIPDHEAVILLAHDLSPTDTLELSLDRICCFATEEGGRTAHTGILARSLGIPAVVGVRGLEQAVADGDTVILDALKGLVLIKPDPTTLAGYQLMQERFQSFTGSVTRYSHRPAETPCGFRVAVRGNIETPDEAETLTALGGEGIGLYRTEFSFISRSSLPSEQELFEEYSGLLHTMAPHQVTFRTLDVGADKMLWAQKAIEEPNPALGLRAIRYCLRNQDIFRRQLRAILRASILGNAALMFPMISGVRELRQAKAVLSEVKQELDASRIPYDHTLPAGIMIELPSAVMTADALAREVDFFSIGTNDLIQYSLGIDRSNKLVSYLYQPLHPAIIRSIKYVADMAHRAGISVSVCGEMASDPYCLLLLLGMGIDEISMAPHSIPGIKHIIRNISLEECRQLQRQVYDATTVEAANRMAKQTLARNFSQELPFYVSVLDTEE